MPRKLGVLAGTFNPPTRAHIALARAALAVVDEALFVLPRVLPHKQWEGAPFEDRLRMLQAAIENEPRFSIAVSEHGLFIEIAREFQSTHGPGIELYFLCGRDAADRIVNWDYGRPGAFLEQLREYQLLVAPRKGDYQPPPEMSGRIHPLAVPPDYDDVSATEVRRRIKSGGPWEHLVPEEIVPLMRSIYS
jgi:nicotinate-nucleotide adenylyltransferase